MRRAAKDNPIGTTLLVPWEAFGEQGVYIGVLSEKQRPGLSALLRVVWEYCTKCEAYHRWNDNEDEADSDVFDFPWRPVRYRKIETVQLKDFNLSPRCTNREDENDDEDEPPAKKEEIDDLKVSLERDVREPEREPLGVTRPANPLSSRAESIRRWFIYQGKPPGVHFITWKKLADSTRATHQRWLNKFRAASGDILAQPWARAVVEFILREGKKLEWAWSTLSANLSSLASALAKADLYADVPYSVDIREEQYYRDAASNAAARARIASLRGGGGGKEEGPWPKGGYHRGINEKRPNNAPAK